MGNAIARIFQRLVGCGPKEVRILMLGLDGAGKTTILYKFKLGEYVRTVPTVGFNVESLMFKNLSFNVWDVGGQGKIRHLWRQYLINVQGLIFVLDSCNKLKMKTAKQELDKLMSDPALDQDVKLLVLANKQDLSSAIPVSEAMEMVGLNNLKHRKWHIQKCSGKTGEGLFDGLDWLAKAIKEPSNLPGARCLRLPRSFSYSFPR